MSGEQSTMADGDIASAYTLLLSEPSVRRSDLAVHLGRSDDETSVLLNRMFELSLIHDSGPEEAPGPEAPLVAAHPALAMQQLIAREQAVLDERWKRIQRGYELFSSVMPTFTVKSSRPDEDCMPERLDGLHAVRQRLEELAVRAHTEIAAFTPPAANPTNARSASRPLNQAVLARGVRMRTLYPDSILAEGPAMEYAAELVAAGAEIRITPRVPLRLLVVDRRVAVVPLDPNDGSSGGMLIRDPGTVTALMALFESYWHASQSLAELTTKSEECSLVEQTILRLLASGAKDDAVARQLGMSVRTLRRGIADLMDRLNAHSRFELGVEAVKRGWIDR
ncbi:helix-turn-helix transcriptional regulator [Kitasatospora sp. LaBMicrA B282]|uniref:helix-turn-helix transcriptional regulator n=1 Tax=Kitasatospora sp. LaBMicrA B282 TaxID=3420949 RepID=UPI003D14E781